MKPLVMLLAGGGGTRLGVLVQNRSKPAVPFAGNYRIIDMALSNVMRAGLDWVGVLTQYKPLSLMSHIGTGEPWNFLGNRRGVRILPPRTGRAASDWYRGTADAIWQSMDFMEPHQPQRVLILSADHIYQMDYRKMIRQHEESGADVSVAVMEVSSKDSSRFGMVWTDSDSFIRRFEEKPAAADTRLASMGIYLFEWPCLLQALADTVGQGHGTDFGQDVLPALLGHKRLLAHRFDGYWRDVGTVSSYFQSSMDSIMAGNGLALNSWEVCTREDALLDGDLPPSYFGSRARLAQARISGGCRIDGSVQRSVLSPQVQVAEGARVEDAVLMHGASIGPGAVVRRAIVDKDVRIGPGVKIEGGSDKVPNVEYGKCDLDGLVLIGKGVRIPPQVQIGANVVIEAGADESRFPGQVPAGTTVRSARPD